jgi:hypothetical protein
MEKIEAVANKRNLERVGEKKFQSYEDAVTAKNAQIAAQVSNGKSAPAKVKIFARYDGTFDVVVYKKIQTAVEKVIKVAPEKPVEAVHGQKSKDRKKSPKKAQ